MGWLIMIGLILVALLGWLLDLFFGAFIVWLVIRGIVVIAVWFLVIYGIVKAIKAFVNWLSKMNGGNIAKTLWSIFKVLVVAALLLIIPVIVGRIMYF